MSHTANLSSMTASPPILAFNGDGLLPAGDYVLTLAELQDSLLVNGPAGKSEIPGWDMGWRMHLVENLGVLCRQLWQVGISEIYVDGSFVEDKCHPNDIDVACLPSGTVSACWPVVWTSGHAWKRTGVPISVPTDAGPKSA
jgi:hypothetical protein